MDSNMKRIFQYMATLLFLLAMGTSCEEGNDNWRVITKAQPGAYIIGDATVYSATATSSQLVPAPLDNAPEGTNVVGIYTWLKASGNFTILSVDEKGNQVSYGKGDVVTSAPAETVALATGGTPFTVAKDGLYYVAMNKADNQLTLIPATFGIIGDATPLQWNGETAMQASYNETQLTVEFTISDVTLDKKEMKFRYSGDWGLEFPYQGGKVKLHTNMGYNGDDASAISEAFSECKGGGANFKVGKVGVYTITLKLNLRTGQFAVKAVCTAEDVSSATLPEKMFVIGDPWDWKWENTPEMIPVHSHEGIFWGIYYIKANQGIKFNNETSSDTGDNFGVENEDPKGYGEYPSGGSNLKVADEGYYLVIVSCSLSADKSSVNKKIVLAEPQLNLIGDCAGGWAKEGEPAKLISFTLESDGTYQATTIYNAPVEHPEQVEGELRMYVTIADADWWQSEFMIFDGKVKYRGAGTDQERVKTGNGKRVILDFRTNTGSVN